MTSSLSISHLKNISYSKKNPKFSISNQVFSTNSSNSLSNLLSKYENLRTKKSKKLINKVYELIKSSNGDIKEVSQYINSITEEEMMVIYKSKQVLLKKRQFSQEEDENLLYKINEYGLDFNKISREFKNKSANDLKRRYNRIKNLNNILLEPMKIDYNLPTEVVLIPNLVNNSMKINEEDENKRKFNTMKDRIRLKMGFKRKTSIVDLYYNDNDSIFVMNSQKSNYNQEEINSKAVFSIFKDCLYNKTKEKNEETKRFDKESYVFLNQKRNSEYEYDRRHTNSNEVNGNNDFRSNSSLINPQTDMLINTKLNKLEANIRLLFTTLNQYSSFNIKDLINKPIQLIQPSQLIQSSSLDSYINDNTDEINENHIHFKSFSINQNIDEIFKDLVRIYDENEMKIINNQYDPSTSQVIRISNNEDLNFLFDKKYNLINTYIILLKLRLLLFKTQIDVRNSLIK